MFAGMLMLGLARSGRADAPPTASELGDCAGRDDVVCHRTLRGNPVTGMCSSVRGGFTVCSVDEDSQKKAAALMARRAERSSRESVAVTVVAGLSLMGLAVVIFLGWRRRRRDAAAKID